MPPASIWTIRKLLENGPQGPSICDLINGLGLVDAQIRRVPAILPDLPHHLANLWLNHQSACFLFESLTAVYAQPSDDVAAVPGKGTRRADRRGALLYPP